MAAPGGVPERPKGTGCKPVGSAYGGSNPPAPIALQRGPGAALLASRGKPVSPVGPLLGCWARGRARHCSRLTRSAPRRKGFFLSWAFHLCSSYAFDATTRRSRVDTVGSLAGVCIGVAAASSLETGAQATVSAPITRGQLLYRS